MTKTVFIIGIVLLFSTLYSCSSKESLVQAPSFLAAINLPEKPSFENNDEFADYFSENYDTLEPANITRVEEGGFSTRNPNFNVDQYLSPTLIFGISFGNTYGNGFGCDPFSRYNRYNPFNDSFYNPYGYYGFSNNSLYSNYLCGCSPSGWINNSYYSRYYNGFYWGVPRVYSTYNSGSHDDNYYQPVPLAPSLPKSVYTQQSIDLPYTQTNKNPTGKINYAKPVSKPKTKGAVRTSYTARTNYNYATQLRTTSRSGYYRPPSSPVNCGSPSGSGYGTSSGHRPNSGNLSRSYYQPIRTSSGSGYKPSSGGGYKPSGGGGSKPTGGGGNYTPSKTRSTAESASPRR